MQRRRWPPEQALPALALLEGGAPASEVARRTGIPATTLRGWRSRGVPARLHALEGPRCAACGAAPHEWSALPVAAYAYLLGVYLGDGSIARGARGVHRLVIGLDVAYPGIVEEVAAAVEAVRGRPAHVGRRPGRQWVLVSSYAKWWPCAFPQHGPGRKHERPIVLADWQRAIVEREPGRFVRGLVHTDGWRGDNRVVVKGREYRYPRYQFSNRSAEIRALFEWGCDLLGVAHRPWGRWNVSVARREAVALLDEHVGPKQ